MREMLKNLNNKFLTIFKMEKEIFEKIEEFLENKDEAAARKEMLNLTPSEIAKIINRFQRGKRKLFVLLPPELQAEVAQILSRKLKKTIIPRLGNLIIIRFLYFMNYDSDVVDILQLFSSKRQKEIIRGLQPFRRVSVEKLLNFSPESAGGIMDYNFITVNDSVSFGEVKLKMEAYEKEFKQIPAVIVQEKDKKDLNYLPFQRIIFANSELDIKKFARPITLVHYNEDEASLIKNIQNGEQILGVVSDSGDLMGVIKIEDLAKISLREATENIYGFAGVQKEEEIFDSPLVSIKMRSGWLLINLLTAFLAAAVVGLFQGTIAKLVILAAYMPVVAGMGGNAATQTLAVTVRSIALGDITLKNSFYVLKKEILTSLGNGFIVGIAASLAAFMFNANIYLGLILFAALVINLIVAGFFGAIIPLFLKFFKVDPALAATVFVTTATDIFGFFAFLGLAKLFLV